MRGQLNFVSRWTLAWILIVCGGMSAPPAQSADSRPATAIHHQPTAEPRESAALHVVVTVRPGVDLGQLVGDPVRRSFLDPMGHEMVVGTLRASDIEKLAQVDGVVDVRPAFGLIEPPLPPDPDLPDPHRLRRGTGAAASAKDWYEATDVHRFREAWDNGFTGSGVRVMINDSGIDFCHPDLHGTWATVEDPSSPYFGWPMMFDPHSMYLLYRDQTFGESNIANGAGHIADTTSTCAEGGACSYRPVGSSAARSYTLPGTSVGGTYRIGSHPDSSLNADGGRAAVLLADETTAGVYDTVYVDLDQDYDFSNDTPATRSSPSACGTYDRTARSGGLVYFIADGVNPVPASDWYWGLDVPGNGDLVAFIIDDANETGSGHGTKCASAVAAQGVVNGGAPSFKPAYSGPGDGMVVGVARDAKLVSVGNTFNNPGFVEPFVMAALGYDGEPGTGDEIQVVTNSWGYSSVDNDGWDLYSRVIDAVQMDWAPEMSVLFSAGNGGPGFGTLGPPAPPSGIIVAASTEMGSTGWDEISSADQITWGDIAPFSSRGPEIRGTAGIDVAAVGAYAAGDITVNQHDGDVESAWTTWGGTSRACPIAGGHVALVYDAYRQANGAWPSFEAARAILMAGAVDLHNDPFVQGAGMADAARSTAIAGGTGSGAYARPPVWEAGDYRGTEYPAFAHVVYPGQTARGSFELVNPGGAASQLDVTAERLQLIGQEVFDWTTTGMTHEAAYDFDTPGYLRNITDSIPEGTELLVVRVIQPLDELDHDGDMEADSTWRYLLYDWSDDGDGQLWSDGNGNGTVNPGELDDGDDYVRFTYSRGVGTAQELRVQRPLQRMHDGIWLGLQHQERDLEIRETHFQVRLEFYAREHWSWIQVPSSVTVPAGGSATFDATMTVPAGAQPGLVEGSLWLDDGEHRISVPVVASVAAELGDEPMVFGASDGTTPYDNGAMAAVFHWTSRAYDGDWRLFFFDVPSPPPAGASLLVQTIWQDGPPTDIDTLILGPTSDPDHSGEDPSRYGPYTLSVIGRSPNLRIQDGTWGYGTSTGGSEDWVSAELDEGLHALLLHKVLANGSPDLFRTPVDVTANWMIAGEDSIEVNRFPTIGRFTYFVQTGSALERMDAEAFGFACDPATEQGQVVEDGVYELELQVADSGRLDVLLDGPGGDDLDLIVTGPGGTPVVSSTSSGPDERVVVDRPADGTWEVRVLGYSVAGASSSFELTLDSLEGGHFTDVTTPPGPFAAGSWVPIQLQYSIPTESSCDDWRGLLFYGPGGGDVIEVPVSVVTQSSRQGSGRVAP